MSPRPRGLPSLWRRLTDLGTDSEVDELGLPPGQHVTTCDAIAAGMRPPALMQAMARIAAGRRRDQLTVAGCWHHPSHAADALEEIEQLWASGLRGGIYQPGTDASEARSVLRLVDGEAPRLSGRRSSRRRRPLAITLSAAAYAALCTEAARLGTSISDVVDQLALATRPR